MFWQPWPGGEPCWPACRRPSSQPRVHLASEREQLEMSSVAVQLWSSSLASKTCIFLKQQPDTPRVYADGHTFYTVRVQEQSRAPRDGETVAMNDRSNRRQHATQLPSLCDPYARAPSLIYGRLFVQKSKTKKGGMLTTGTEVRDQPDWAERTCPARHPRRANSTGCRPWPRAACWRPCRPEQRGRAAPRRGKRCAAAS